MKSDFFQELILDTFPQNAMTFCRNDWPVPNHWVDVKLNDYYLISYEIKKGELHVGFDSRRWHDAKRIVLNINNKQHIDSLITVATECGKIAQAQCAIHGVFNSMDTNKGLISTFIVIMGIILSTIILNSAVVLISACLGYLSACMVLHVISKTYIKIIAKTMERLRYEL